MSKRKKPTIAAAIVRSLLPLNILELLAQEPQHGLQIAGQVERASAGVWTPSAGTLYPMLQRMETDGLVRSKLQQSAGAPRRVYKLTAKGRRSRSKLRADLVAQLRVAKELVDKHLEVLAGDESHPPHTAEEMARALVAHRSSK